MKKSEKWRIKRTPHNLFLISTCYISVIGIIICGSLLDSEHYILYLVLIGIFIGWLMLFSKVNEDIISRYIYHNYYEDYNKKPIKCDKCFYKTMYKFNYDFSLKNINLPAYKEKNNG